MQIFVVKTYALTYRCSHTSVDSGSDTLFIVLDNSYHLSAIQDTVLGNFPLARAEMYLINVDGCWEIWIFKDA